MYLRRLTNDEYLNTVRDLFGEITDPTTSFPADTNAGGFLNNAEVPHLSDVHLSQYQRAAESIANEVMTGGELRSRILTCDATSLDACLQTFVAGLGRRVFRRPLAAEEASALVALGRSAQDDPSSYAPYRLVIEGLLQSPNFLFRVEVGEESAEHPQWRKLTDYEMAVRLSYYLLGTTPSDSLLDTAERGELETEEDIANVAQQMLEDSRATARIRDFYSQWLDVSSIEGVVVSPSRHPDFNPALLADMAEEARRFADDFFLQQGANVLELWTAPYTYVNAALASHYGLPTPGQDWVRVDSSPAHPMSGMLTQGGFLTGHGRRGAPIFRGHFVRASLLCETLPPPPPDVPELDRFNVDELTEEELLRQHQEDPACKSCHELMDSIGFGLSRYDGVGVYSERHPDGSEISETGELVGFNNPAFEGPLELGRRLVDSGELSRCVVKHVLRFAQGRREAPEDACTVESMHSEFEQSDFDFRSLLMSMVRSDAFRFRNPALEGGE